MKPIKVLNSERVGKGKGKDIEGGLLLNTPDCSLEHGIERNYNINKTIYIVIYKPAQSMLVNEDRCI